MIRWLERGTLTCDEADIRQSVRPLRRPWKGYDVTGEKYVADSSICERQGLCARRFSVFLAADEVIRSP